MALFNSQQSANWTSTERNQLLFYKLGKKEVLMVFKFVFKLFSIIIK